VTAANAKRFGTTIKNSDIYVVRWKHLPSMACLRIFLQQEPSKSPRQREPNCIKYDYTSSL